MKRWIVGAVIALSAVTATAQPDKDWWACQYASSAGLNWADGKWSATAWSVGKPFALMSDGNGSLTTKSVAKVLAMEELEEDITCLKGVSGAWPVVCNDTLGQSLVFDYETGFGGLSQIIALTRDADQRKFAIVTAFECAKG